MADLGCLACQHSHELCEKSMARHRETSLEATAIIQGRHEKREGNSSDTIEVLTRNDMT